MFFFSNVCVYVSVWCVCVGGGGTGDDTCHGMYMEVRGQLQVLGPIFHFLWVKVSCSQQHTSDWLVLKLPRIRLCASHLALEALGLQTHTTVSSSPRILEMWSKVLTLGQLAVYRWTTSPATVAVLSVGLALHLRLTLNSQSSCLIRVLGLQACSAMTLYF